MIPTVHKAKIPQTLSYPLNAGVISDALRGTPQFERLVLKFSRRRSTDVPCPLLEASYLSAPLAAYLGGWQWVLTIYPVPRVLRKQIQAKLLAEALPAVRAWWMHAPSGDRDGGHHLLFSYDELADGIQAEERASLDWRTVRE